MVSTVVRRGWNAVLPLATVLFGGAVLTGLMPNLRVLTSAESGMAHALIQFSDLPKPSHPVGAPLEMHRFFTHYATVLPVSIFPGAYACYPPSVFSKLHMTHALAQTMYSGGGGASMANWNYCAYTFGSTGNAHNAFLALAKPLKVSVKQGTGSHIRSHGHIGTEWAGLNYSPNPIEAQLQIVVRAGRSVGYLQYKANGYTYTVTQFLHLATVASSRLPR
jgi:hypothetical protein